MPKLDTMRLRSNYLFVCLLLSLAFLLLTAAGAQNPPVATQTPTQAQGQNSQPAVQPPTDNQIDQPLKPEVVY